MDYKKTMDKLKTILNSEDLGRCHRTKIDGETALFLELHTLKTKEAKRLIQNVLLCTVGESVVACNHGYRRGDSNRRKIQEEIFSRRVISKDILPENPGMTYVKLAA